MAVAPMVQGFWDSPLALVARADSAMIPRTREDPGGFLRREAQARHPWSRAPQPLRTRILSSAPQACPQPGRDGPFPELQGTWPEVLLVFVRADSDRCG